MTVVQCRILFEGEVSGEVLRLDEPLSFWGGFDPITGIILDNNHPQRGACLRGKILVLPATRGSGGTPGGVAESIRNGSGPAAIIMGDGDTNVMIGAAVALKLYGLTCPVLEVTGPDYDRLANARAATVARDGSVLMTG